MDRYFSGVLIATDMDCTLLNDEKKVTERNREAIRRFVDRGGVFTIATGRSVQSVKWYLEMLGVNAPVICYNGSVIYDPTADRVVKGSYVPTEALVEMMEDVLAQFPDVGVELYNDDSINIIRENERTRIHMERERLIHLFRPYSEVASPWLKAIFVAENQRLKEVEQYLRGREYSQKYPEVRFVYSEDWFYETLGVETSKGTAVHELCNLLHIAPEHCYTAGDNYNDLELIAAGQLGFAVANAKPEVKAAADAIVCSNNDGAIADIVELLEERYAPQTVKF